MSQLVDQSLGKPIQGVSQQAESLRPQGQCNEQINFLPDPVVGLRRRPPTKKIANITKYNLYMDYIDAEGDKLLCINDTEVGIFNPNTLTITPVTVTNSFALDYLQNTTQVSVAYVEDTLYISNPTVTVAEDTTIAADTRFNNVGIVFCLGGQYSREYTVDITLSDSSTITASYNTPDGTNAGDIDTLKSTNIITELFNVISGNAALDVRKHKDHMVIDTKSTESRTITSITCSDDEGNVALKCAFGSVKDIVDLPEFAPNGTILTITGDSGTEDDAYFEFKLLNGTDTSIDSFGSSGVWIESVKFGEKFEFQKDTLPVRIYDDAGTMRLDLADWKGREIGDSESNETPSLLNKKVRDITSIQGRLGLLSDDTVLFSRTKRPTELWRRSIIGGILDDDAIDGSGDSATGVHTYFVKNAQDLAIFSLQGQYVILGDTALTHSSMNLTLTTRNTSLPNVKPIGLAGNIYYPIDNGDFTGVNEYYKEDRTYFSIPVSSQVPRYVIGEATKMQGSKPQKMLCLQTQEDADILYCYKFLFSGQQRIQSAWFKMQFNNDIKHYFFTSNSMILVFDGDGEDIIERLDFDSIETSGLNFSILLDRQITYTLDANNEITFDPLHTGDVLFISNGSSSAGLPVDFEDVGGGKYRILAGSEGDTVTGGFRYTSTYVPTAPRVFDRNREVIQTGELNVRNLSVNVADSGVFDWDITTNYGHSYGGELSNRVWGAANNLIGSEPLQTRRWTIPWRGKATERTCTISCNAHTPLNISYIEFTGDLRKTRTRI